MRLSQSSDLQLANLLIDKRSHPATPRFLLSLLATSIYLNIPSVTAQALTLVLCSVTPFTVTQYLRFAIGCGIEGTDLNKSASDVMLHDLDEWDWELEGPARTLEEVARLDTRANTTSQSQPSAAFDSFDESEHSDFAADFSRKLSVASSPSTSRHASVVSPAQSPPQGKASSHSSARAREGASHSVREDKPSTKKTAGLKDSETSGLALRSLSSSRPEYQYGLTADKIGEACVCWFARWGYDIFELECSMERERIIEIETWIRMCRDDRDIARLTLLRDRLHTGDVDLLHTSMLPRGRMPDPGERMPSPRLRVWSYPSMPSAWVRAIISSDGFYVPSELHRYKFAQKVVEFRRKQKALINVLDRLIDDWLREDEIKSSQKQAEAFDSTKKMGGDPKPSNASSASSDAGDGFGFKAFRRAPSVSAEDDMDPSSTPLQEAWDDGMDSTTFSASIDDDEAEYEELFSSGIYYSHMPFSALNEISADTSPTTGRPYTPLHVLQAALWVSNELKTHILTSARSSPVLQEAEAGSEATDASTQSMDGSSELGVSSSITQFRDVFESLANGSSSPRRFSRSRSGTPMSGARDPDATLSFNSSMGLGGLAATPLMLGALGGGKAGLLNKKYYLVPSDDTVRFGDGLTSVIGVTSTSTTNAGRGSGSDDERVQAPATFGDDQLGPSGTAAIQIPHTLPIPAVMHHDPSNATYQRRDRSRYYGIANDVATGRELGEYAYRHLASTAETSSSRAPMGSSASRQFDEIDTRRSFASELGAHSHDPNDDADGCRCRVGRVCRCLAGTLERLRTHACWC